MDNVSQFWYLRNIDLFSNLSDSEITALNIIISHKKGIKGEIIDFNNSNDHRIFILKHGRLKLAYQDDDDSEIVTEILKENDVFGEIYLGARKNMYNEYAVIVSEDAYVCSFAVDDFKKVLLSNPSLSVNYAMMIGEKLQQLNAKYADLFFKDAKTRIINFFKLHAKYEGKKIDNNIVINNFLTHQDIANYTATSRQTVSTIISELEKEGKLIYEGRKKLIIPNINLL